VKELTLKASYNLSGWNVASGTVNRQSKPFVLSILISMTGVCNECCVPNECCVHDECCAQCTSMLTSLSAYTRETQLSLWRISRTVLLRGC